MDSEPNFGQPGLKLALVFNFFSGISYFPFTSHHTSCPSLGP